MLEELMMKMIEFDYGDPKRIQHFIKVHSFSKLIGEKEGLDTHTLFVLEAASILHDIGIRVSEEKYGFQNGKLQEQEGPAPAREICTSLGFLNCKMKLELRNWDKGACPFIPIRAAAGPYSQFFV